MRTQLHSVIRSTGLPQRWNGSRGSRDPLLARARGLRTALNAESAGHNLKVGRHVFTGVAPGACLVIGDHVTLYDGVRFNVDGVGARLVIGDRTYVNSGSQVFCSERVSIGSDTAIGFGCLITDTNFHHLDDAPVTGAVQIGDHVWLGAGVTVLPGVHIGDGAVVGAGSVVTRDLEPGTLSAGSPARFIRAVSWAL